MKFVDEAVIEIKAGDGGKGLVHFLRAKFKPMGGPDGGDGGKGGDVYCIASSRRQTLTHLYHKPAFKASPGEAGKAESATGAAGKDLEIQVPAGSQIYDDDTGDLLFDMMTPNQRVLVAKGGIGGQGNRRFATSTNQAPMYAQPGLPGEEKNLRVELKLIADVGLVGLPNAGKSTLLSNLTDLKAKIGNYPFTTLTPNIAVLETNTGRRLLLADIPGIIEGAHKGAGLGLSFLRHIERVTAIVYMLDATSADPSGDLQMLRNELESYDPALLEKPGIIVFNKMDQASYDKEIEKELANDLIKISEMESPSAKKANLKTSKKSPVSKKVLTKKSAVGKTSKTSGGATSQKETEKIKLASQPIFISAKEHNGLEVFVKKLFGLMPKQTFAERLAGLTINEQTSGSTETQKGKTSRS